MAAKSARRAAAMTEIHIHEDDWGMRCIHPVAAWPESTADLARAVETGKRNAAPDGLGWTGIHLVEAPSIDFTATSLRLDALAAALDGVMPRVTSFIATATAGFDRSRRDPYGSYETSAWSYGHDATCFVKLEPAGDLVRAIWFEARTADPARLESLSRAFALIDEMAEAMIVDYWLEAAGRIRDGAFMQCYLAALAGE
jgi:hypothetical protein